MDGATKGIAPAIPPGIPPGIPDGFHPLPPLGETFNTLVGPLWLAVRDGRLVAGLPVEKRHCNPAGTLHGGMTATLVDIYMSLALQFAHDVGAAIPVTVTLNVDYIAAATPGHWIEARAEIDRAGAISFLRALVTTPKSDGGERLLSRSSAVFRSVATRPGAPPPPHVGNMLRTQFGLPPFPSGKD